MPSETEEPLELVTLELLDLEVDVLDSELLVFELEVLDLEVEVAELVGVEDELTEQQVNCTQAVSTCPPVVLPIVKKNLTTALAGMLESV